MGKITDGLGNVLGGLGHYARETLPYIAQAASAYGNVMSTSSPSTVTTSDTRNPLIYQPNNVNLPYVTPIPLRPSPLITLNRQHGPGFKPSKP